MSAQSQLTRTTRMARLWAVFRKEFIQLQRDRVTFATMIIIPLMQLFLFGYAINTNPRHLPTAVLIQEESDIGRSILAALKNTAYFDIKFVAKTEREVEDLINSGEVLFVIEIPANFARSVRRGEMPSLLVIADATDPLAAGTALGSLEGIITTALRRDRLIPYQPSLEKPFTIVQHRRFNPAGETQLNVVPGLLGTILTMTMLIFTSLSVTREIERGTMESLLAMPIQPLEIMLGKISPYIIVGFIQAAIILILGVLAFHVPIEGSLLLLAGLTTLFVTTNLSVGYTFSTISHNQLQAVQLSMMWFLPNVLLSGFIFPFAGMPKWAQFIGQFLPLTHFLRIVRGIMLKGSDLSVLGKEALWLVFLMLIAMTIAVSRFRRTLD